MRAAVISDIHANLHALKAILADVDREGVEEVWCLGDIVGYGPRPNECCDLVRERAAISLCGNHDLAVLGSLDITDFTGDAATAARWTTGVLGDSQREWLTSLEPLGRRGDAQLFHASARDPVWEYVLSEQAALASLLETDAPLVLVGHSHVALAIGSDGKLLEGGLAPFGTTVARPGRRWLLNPGSVGQPRDGDPRAAWLLLDGETASFRRVGYDIGATQTEIRELGLPVGLATRLTVGI
jgi:predicted phosphodiesterase